MWRGFRTIVYEVVTSGQACSRSRQFSGGALCQSRRSSCAVTLLAFVHLFVFFVSGSFDNSGYFRGYHAHKFRSHIRELSQVP